MTDLLLAWEIRSLIQDILVVLLLIIALFYGAWPERAAIGIWWICIEVPGFIVRDFLGYEADLTGVDLVMASMDFAAGALWIALALYANRNYTLWVAGAQLLAIAAHVARGMVESISPIGYVFLVIAPGWLQIAAMSVGFIRHYLRTRKYGQYRDWRISARPIDGQHIVVGELK